MCLCRVCGGCVRFLPGLREIVRRTPRWVEEIVLTSKHDDALCTIHLDAGASKGAEDQRVSA
ncbi:hypothetical protein TC41_1775 [Alicyclobacillus acidocaldarius subsp. acidocaldarius Tc-4-1]|uniref:Uncharacterized protein n=1 Tax=Alicyclobacillus acidocaldarius (strain Tc-4-1) TaxID=1048834 RepID=F8ICN3_ALIAT|nr:hypothetical protein TC41_1775 [Alicyclobacillus acidocaldarius subsp. acidocaldarius Tc-4-1]